MKNFILALTIGLLVSLPAFSRISTVIDQVDRPLQPIASAECTVPTNIQGEVMAEAIMTSIRENGRVFRGAFGGCGQWDLTPEQRSNLPALLLADVKLQHPGAECKILSSTNEPHPFGLSVNILCWKTAQVDGESFMVYLVTGVVVDTDGEVAVILAHASDK